MLVITLYSLYNDFEIIIIPLFYLVNKDLKEIQLIIVSIKTPNLAKQATNITRNLIIMAKKKKT